MHALLSIIDFYKICGQEGGRPAQAGTKAAEKGTTRMAEISSTGDQMLQLLEIVAFEGPASTAALAQAAGINRTVAHRLLATLHQRGYLVREGKTFTLGPLLSRIAAESHEPAILIRARAVIQDLAERLGETVVIHKIDGDATMVVEQAVSDAQLVRVQHREGSRHLLTMGASGRAILAHQSDAFIARLLAREDRLDLEVVLQKIRTDGISRSENELQSGVLGYAVPLREAGGTVRFSLAVLIPSQRSSIASALPQALKAAQSEIEAA